MKLASKIKLYVIKKTMKRIDKYLKFIEKCNGYIKSTKGFIKEEKKIYLKQLKELSIEEKEYLFGEINFDKLLKENKKKGS